MWTTCPRVRIAAARTWREHTFEELLDELLRQPSQQEQSQIEFVLW